jgi:hypothetical protein
MASAWQHRNLPDCEEETYLRPVDTFEWLKRLYNRVGFTDIEFNPERSLNCQARSFATFVALEKRGILDETIHSFDRFRSLLETVAI